MEYNEFYEHERQVQEFLEKCKCDDEERYDAICEKYPVQSASRKKTVRRREITVGLLGLCPSRVALSTASRHDVESVYTDEGSQ